MGGLLCVCGGGGGGALFLRLWTRSYTDKGGIKHKNSNTIVCLPVGEIIHSLKLVDYFLVQADKSWYKLLHILCGTYEFYHKDSTIAWLPG